MTRLTAMLVMLSVPALAEPAQVLRVTDGDSIRVLLAGREVAIRVAGIDSAEIVHAKCERERELGLAAKREAERLLPRGAVVEITRVPRQDKYGRLLASITLPDGTDYASILLQRGLARKYNGGRKESWCE
jgi:endonuclease YncB( thermonuclease family)